MLPFQGSDPSSNLGGGVIVFCDIDETLFCSSFSHIVYNKNEILMKMKIDPYKHKERHLRWKEKASEGISDISNPNSKILIRYLTDMEYGLNIANSSKKGARSYIRLNTLRQSYEKIKQNSLIPLI